MMDDAVGYAPVLVAEAALLHGAPEGLEVVSTDDSFDAQHLARLDTRAVVLRPDRYILGSADDRNSLVNLCATAVHSHAPKHLETL